MNQCLINHVDLVTAQAILQDQMLRIEDGRIKAILPAGSEFPAGIPVLDGKGTLLAPGLIDLQINGGFGLDFTQDPNTIWEVARLLPQYGVTTFLPTIITAPLDVAKQAMQAVTSGRPQGFQGAEPLGLHIEGPFLNLQKKGAHNPNHLQQPALDLVRDWTPQNGVRLVTLAPELPGALEMVRQLTAQGVMVSAGHSTATYEQALEAFEAGVRYGTHLFNAMPQLEHRAPNLPGALLTDPRVGFGLIADGIHVDPVMVAIAWRAKGGKGFTLVTDAMGALGMASGTYHLGDFDVIVDETSARLANGILAGSILTEDAALRNLMKFTGCSLVEAIPALTQAPADILGLQDRGKIEPGCRADLVLLDRDFHVAATLVAGQMVYDRLNDL